MKVTKVNYQKIFPTGMAYLNHKIGVEVDVEEGDDYDECFRGAKALVEQWNLESNPSYSLTMEYMKPQADFSPDYVHSKSTTLQTQFSEQPTPTIDEKAEGMKEIIRIANTKVLLERQRGQIERMNNPELTEMFNDKLKTFE